jgi:hypothetical protein
MTSRQINRLLLLGGAILAAVCMAAVIFAGIRAALANPDWLHLTALPSPHSSAAAAKRRGTWICDVAVVPKTISWEGEAIEFQEAWVEEAARDDYAGIPYDRRLGLYYLCFTLARGKEIVDRDSLFFVPEGEGSSFAWEAVGGERRVWWFDLHDRHFSSLKMSLVSSWHSPRPDDISLTSSP